MVDYNSTYTGAQIDANLAKAATAVQPADDAADLGSGAATDGYVLTADGAGGAAWEAAAGGGGTPGGSDTQVQFNDGGAFGGDSGFTFDKTNNTLGLGGGTITASDPIIDMAQTWNNGAVAFTALKANVTDTASAAGSLLMDLRVGGASRFSVAKGAGAIFAENLIEQRNGTTAQAFNLYNVFSTTSDYDRGFMRWSSNILQIGTEKAGTSITARALAFQTDGTTRLTIETGGTATFAGNVSAGRFIGNTFIGVGGSGTSPQVWLAAPSSGVIKLTDSGDSTFNRVQFGGTTSSFPAIKRSTTSLQARLADDSAFTNIQGKLTTDTAYNAGAPTATGYIVLFDSAGTAYKVPAEAL